MIAGRRLAAAAVVFAVVVVGCSTSSPSDVRAASVYEAVVRWFADRGTDDPEPLPVFIEARGEGASIDLAVQAELIDLTAEDAIARFIDSREEAVADDGEDDSAGPTVRDDGVLIRLDPVLENGPPMTLDVDEYVDETTFRTLRFTLSQSTDDTWRVVGEPVAVSSP